MKLFDLIDNIVASRDDIGLDEVEASYDPFIINRAMSNYYDCIMYASEMNTRDCLSKKQQYDFYRIAINPKRKRFAKWSKPETTERISIISEFYRCNKILAEQYSSLLSDAMIADMKEKLSKGGRR